MDELLTALVAQRELAASLPFSREMALTVTKIDEAIMWASAAKTLEDLTRQLTEATGGE